MTASSRPRLRALGAAGVLALLLTGCVPGAGGEAALQQSGISQRTPAAGGTAGRSDVRAEAPAENSPTEAANTPPTSYIRLDSISPRVGPGTDLVVSGKIVNNGEAPLKKPSLNLELRREALSTRGQLDTWAETPRGASTIARSVTAPDKPADGDSGKKTDGAATAKVEGTPGIPVLPKQIGAGSDASFRFTVDGDDLGLPRLNTDTAWGVRGLLLELSGEQGGKDLASAAPTFTTWYPSPNILPSKISTLLPMAGPTDVEADGLISADSLEEAAGPRGELGRLLAGSAGSDAAWALDPQLLESVQTRLREAGEDVAGAEGTDGAGAATQEPADGAPTDVPDPTTTGGQPTPTTPGAGTEGAKKLPQLEAWYKTLIAEGKKRAVIATPWADPDLRVLSGGAAGPLLGKAVGQEKLVTRTFAQAATGIAWPLTGGADIPTIRAAAGAGNSTVILSDLQQPFEASYTPSTWRRLNTGDGDVGALVSDSGLSGQLALLDPSAAGALKPAAGLSPVTTATTIARIVADTATITAQRPSDPRSILMTAPRGFDPDAAGLKSLLATLADVPWIDSQSMDRLMKPEDPIVSKLTTPGKPIHLDASALAPAIEANAKMAVFNGVTADPAAANEALDRQTLGLTAARWLGRDAEWRERIAAFAGTAAKDSASIQPSRGSSVLLVTGDQAKISVQVSNKFSRSARVAALLEPATPQLRGGTSPVTEIPPGESGRLEVPVRGVANGNVQVRVVLQTAEGQQIGEATNLTVRVRADWENIGTAVVGGLLALVLIFGVTRTIVTGRRKVPEGQLAAAVAESERRLDTAEIQIVNPLSSHPTKSTEQERGSRTHDRNHRS